MNPDSREPLWSDPDFDAKLVRQQHQPREADKASNKVVEVCATITIVSLAVGVALLFLAVLGGLAWKAFSWAAGIS